MAGSKISFSYEGIGRLLRSPGMEEHMIQRAKRIMDLAESRAPVYTGTGRDPTRGSYKAAFRIESSLRGGDRHDRAEARVVNDDPTAIFIEKGTRAHEVTYRDRNGRERKATVPAMEARHVLGSSMMAAGGDS